MTAPPLRYLLIVLRDCFINTTPPPPKTQVYQMFDRPADAIIYFPLTLAMETHTCRF